MSRRAKASRWRLEWRERLSLPVWPLAALLTLVLAGCSEPADEAPAPQVDVAPQLEQPQVPRDPQAIAANNRGVGLMGRFDYAAAREAFEEVVARQPEWLDARVNLAIATLNRQEAGDEAAALTMVDEVIAEDPDHLRAHYVAGLLRLYLGDPGAAAAHFRRVAEADPDDAYAAYFLGQTLAQQSELEAALEQYRRALALDPYLRSAAYGLFQALRRTGQTAEARALMADYQRLEKNPRARLAEFKYTRMGPKAEALALDRPAPEVPPVAPQGPPFGAPVVLLPYEVPPADRPYSVTVVDIQGDGRLDLFLAGAGADGGSLLLAGTGDHGYRLEADHPLAPVGAVNAALWGDYDNDGLVDVYLCRKGANQLWRQAPAGQWTDVTEASGTGGGAFDTRDGAFVDADHDGDLDLFAVNADGPNELLSNNLDGSFRPIAAEQGIAGDGRASRQVVPVDLDGDRDLDLVIVNVEPPHDVYMNDRLWRYHAASEGLDDLRAEPALAMVAGDADTDGLPELFTVSPQGAITRWRLDEAGEYLPEALAQAPLAGEWAQLALADADGDGRLDLWRIAPSGWSVLDALDGRELAQASPDAADSIVGASPMVWDAGSGPALLTLQSDRGVVAWPPGLGRHPFLALTLSGRTSTAESMRSNASGLGAHLALRVDSRWTLATTLDRHSGPGQGLQPLALGLGGARQADFVAIDWSDGVFQSELDLAAGALHAISETQRQLSSCPVLFAWDGQRWAFVSDFLGVGGIGYAIGPGEYATPRPWENVLLPDGLLQPQDGLLRLKVTEPMEEVAYLDAVRLVAYDLPPGWQLVLDERMATGEPEATGEVRFYRREMLPVAAFNDRGEDVTGTLTEADGQAAPVGPLDGRFIGRLAAEHVLTLMFPQPLDATPGAPLLVADGWVEYPYSQTQFAAWQAGARFEAPSVEAQSADGRWHRVLTEFGYPAGMPRRMSVPLPDLPAGTRTLRLRSNMEVYWDRIAVAFLEEPPSPVERTVLDLRSARQAQIGFPLWSVGAQRRPSYDYARRRPFWDTRYPAGLYTRLGPVDELVQVVDDAAAVIAPGEAVDLAFAPPPAPLPDGWTRSYVLETHGWAKDMDLFTQDGETVDPMPSSGRPAGPRDALHERYLTRYLAGR